MSGSNLNVDANKESAEQNCLNQPQVIANQSVNSQTQGQPQKFSSRKKRLHTALSRDRKRENAILKKSIERYNRNKFSYDNNAQNQPEIHQPLENLNEERECGPGDYEVPILTGSKDVPYSHIKTPPAYSFSRTGLSVPMNQSVSSKGLNQSLEQVIGGMQAIRNSYLNKSTVVKPGVGQYNVDCYDLKTKAPKATIGNDKRFKAINVMQAYKLNLPSSYQSLMKPSPKSTMGKIGNARRFDQAKHKTPGPGAYRTEMYKSLSRDNITALSREGSVSPLSPSSPYHGSINYLNKTSRGQQEKLYYNEYEKALYNKAGPGPGYYEYEKFVSSLSDKQNRFSIPRVNFFDNNFLQSNRKIGLKDWEKEGDKYPIQHSNITNEIKVTLKSSQRFKMPQFQRKFDIRKMNSLHANMWRKGIIM